MSAQETLQPEPTRAASGRALPLVIFAIAFCVRLVHVLQIRSAPFFSVLMGDSRGYDEWARRIAGGDWLGHEVFYQAPLYPYVLGVIYAVAGRHLVLVRLVQAAIGSAACALVALAAGRLVSRRAGIAAGLILAFYAPAVFFDGLLQKSVLDVFFVSLALWLIARITTGNSEPFERSGFDELTMSENKDHSGGRKKKRIQTARPEPFDSTLILSPSKDERLAQDRLVEGRTRPVRDGATWRTWLWLGLAMGGLSLTRENALVFSLVILAWALAGGASKSATLSVNAKTAAVFLLGLTFVLAPVAVRNTLVGGSFYVTTSQFGPNFYIGNNPKADGTYAALRYGRGAPEYERQDATELAELALGRRLSPADVSSYWTDRARQFITAQPGAWLKLMARKVALLWNRVEMVDTEDQATYADWSPLLRIAGPITHFGVLVPLAVFGMIVTWPLRSRLWVLYALLLAYAASVALFYVFARYRYPLVPLLVIFAAAGVAHLTQLARPEPFDSPLILSPSKDERLAQDRPVRGRAQRAARGSTRSPRARFVTTLGAVAVAAVFANWPLLSTDLMRAVTENNLAVALQAEGRFDEAAAHYQRAIALRSDYAPAYSNLGTVQRARGQRTESIAAYEQALRLQPEYPDAHYNLANALTDEGRSADAVQHFQIALRSVPGSAEVHNNLGIALASGGKRDEAIAEFEAAVRIDPSSAKAHRNLGDALLSAGRGREAIEHFRRATELAPDEGSFHYDYGGVLLEAGRPQDAAAEFRAALKTMPRAPEVHNNLGIALGSVEKLDEAIEEFQEALRIKPDFEDARRNLTMALGAKKRAESLATPSPRRIPNP